MAARDSGARILLGGNPDTTQPGYFYPTTLVADITASKASRPQGPRHPPGHQRLNGQSRSSLGSSCD
ncbi:hypothetical protein [Pseudarthrobacter sp. NS4]|uniref:hypothetical protein n=1 Tax=Pseudarthrobacter sp. NS4 TaxID=2973976 RepID=UPI0021624890|nr:hypothetical protein [Pseudarthrobacter sp. NS4]